MLEYLTGARRGEIVQTLYSFLALFFLLLSYYLVKPLRNSQFLSHFDPNLLPFFYLITPLLSLVITKIFNLFCDYFPKYHVMNAAFFSIIACKLIFLAYLPQGGRVVIVVFYFWASIYFLLALALLWGCINTIFSPDQGERSFGFIALGGTLGSILGAEISSWLTRSPFKDQALLVAALSMAIALGLIFMAIQVSKNVTESKKSILPHNSEISHPVSSQSWTDLKELWNNRYIRGIAVMIFSLAFFNTLIDFQSQKIIDNTYSIQNYQAHFQWLPTSQAQGQEFIQTLRQLPENQQQRAIEKFLPQSADQLRFKQSLKAYNAHKEIDIRNFFSQVYKYQGILSIFLLLILARPLFRHMGLHFAVLILPIFSIGMAAALLFPLEILLLQGLLIIGGALNYSLNNAAKEILYTITSEDARFKLKPLIEGPVMRLGDVSASLLKLGLGFSLVNLLKSTSHWVDRTFLFLALLIGLGWIISIAYTGKQYDQFKKLSTTQDIA